MFQTFRQSMTWLHTWFGLVLGFVLIVVFFFGSLSVFDREIDRWSVPVSRFEPQPMPSFDRLLRPAFERITKPDPVDFAAARSRVDGELPAKLPLMDWSAYTTHRDPVLTLYASFALPNAHVPGDHIHGHMTIDPRDGTPLADGDLKLGSEFFYPLHYGLHIEWLGLGYWIVGLAALAMLLALVSGVVIHRKLLRELFTFRPRGQRQRATLDLHNLTGVVALPFHFMFALTGLIIFAGIYFPVSDTTLQPLQLAHAQAEATATGLPLEPAGVAAPLAPVDPMVKDAQRRWAARGMAGEVGSLFLNHVGDANGYVSIYRAGTDRVALTGQGIHYRAATGELIREEPPNTAIFSTNEFLTGLHLQHFRHWALRFLYLFGGLAGCICIATGFLFFVEKRKAQHAKESVAGARSVAALAVTAITGMLIATLAMLVANRLLPAEMVARSAWQQRIFWYAWLAAGLHAWWRTAPVQKGIASPVWSEQCAVVALLAFGAVLLNALTTGDHLVSTIQAGYWPVVGVDLALLVVGGIAAGVAIRLYSRVAAPRVVSVASTV
jgi:uncharacterized iron-regulated membrane protein